MKSGPARLVDTTLGAAQQKEHDPVTSSFLRRMVNLGSAAAVALSLVGASAATVRADSLCGRWEGCWKGCTDGLTGTVNARITKCGENRYRAVFWGRAFKIMPYRYVSILIAEDDPETGGQRFHVTQKLPIWGCYWMNGAVDGCNFFARYHTDDHVGYFKMTRVCSKK
jgi:hypothetical protein